MAQSALRVSVLQVDGFRNLRGVRIEPGHGANVFVGDNGQGKTSLLEALDYACSLRSFRGALRAQLVGHEAPRARITADVHAEPLGRHYEVTIQRTERTITLDGKRPESAIAYYGPAACVVFHPGDLELIRGGPENRRRLLDRILLRTAPGYGETLRMYMRALRSRNVLLRQRTDDAKALAAYEPTLARTGSRVVSERRALVEHLAAAAIRSVEQVTGFDDGVGVEYRTRGSDDESAYRELLARSLGEDRQRLSTGIGPHGDEIVIRWGGRAARTVASQGQARAVALGLRLAEMTVLRERTGRTPWLLLDDVSSELDRARTARLFEHIAASEAQLWVTTTDPSIGELVVAPQWYRVHDGEVTNVSRA